jgi:toxin ParE1/3/4
MSSRSRPSLTLSHQAREDISNILQYIYEKYGERQEKKYAAALDKAFETITENSGLGHARPDLSKSHRAFIVEQHVVIYRVIDQGVYVSRVLHSRMDFTRQTIH